MKLSNLVKGIAFYFKRTKVPTTTLQDASKEEITQLIKEKLLSEDYVVVKGVLKT